MKSEQCKPASRHLIVALCFSLALSSCASYTTPGAGVSIAGLSQDAVGQQIGEILQQEPAATFPAYLAVARIQASGYRSYSVDSFGQGRYSVVSVREVEEESDFQTINGWPQVAGVAPLNQLLLPERLDKIADLRLAAARLKTDILLVYTFDTRFHVGAQSFAPLNLISLGFLKNKEVTVSTTVSAAFFDVRSEYLYGVSESTSRESKQASVWSEAGALNELRISTERHAFKNLLPELDKTWRGILMMHRGEKKSTDNAQSST